MFEVGHRYRFAAHQEPLNVRFAPRATELLRSGEMARRAIRRHRSDARGSLLDGRNCPDPCDSCVVFVFQLGEEHAATAMQPDDPGKPSTLGLGHASTSVPSRWSQPSPQARIRRGHRPPWRRQTVWIGKIPWRGGDVADVSSLKVHYDSILLPRAEMATRSPNHGELRTSGSLGVGRARDWENFANVLSPHGAKSSGIAG